MVDIVESGYRQLERDRQKNTVVYRTYKNKLLEIALECLERRKKYAKDLEFREEQELKNFLKRDSYPAGGEIKISPELDILWEQIKGIQNKDHCCDIAEGWLEKNGTKIKIDKIQKSILELAKENEDDVLKYMWFATTKNGIEIHPGLHNREEPFPLALGDDCVHALLAGRTGSGKSVALHAIITGLMYEYAPWELNINLADFKILEMSKYGNGAYKAPHVFKIAATDSMEYVVSVIYDMYEKMMMRQKVFSALGIQKIADFRDKFKVALPREILIVDEFQQMYELATPKQTDMINRLIKMVTKLGRATGFHLLFSSQSMSGTVRGDVLANFKLRLCLSASEEVSNMVLGNSAAAKLAEDPVKNRGYLIANAEGGSQTGNFEYTVPFVNEKKGDLTQVLEENARLAAKIGYSKTLDFYREEDVHSLIRQESDESNGGSSLEKDAQIFYQNTRAAVAKNEELNDYILLGRSCVYAKQNGKDTDLEYVPLRNGERKNILCLADSVYQRAYLLGLLGVQFADRKETQNFVLHGEPVVRDLLYRIPKLKKIFKGEGNNFKICKSEDILAHFETSYRMRSVIQKFINLKEEEHTKEKLMEMYADQCEADRQSERKETLELIWNMYGSGIKEERFSFKNLKFTNYWILGFHMQNDMLDEWRKRKVFEKIKKCTNLGMRFIFVGTKAADLPSEVIKSFEYRFLNTNDEMNFNKFGMRPPKEYRENVLWFQALNESLNSQKPGLYVLEQDQKMVKKFDVDWQDSNEQEKNFFQGIFTPYK